LLETEWVLRGVYKLQPNAILRGFSHILGLPNIVLEQEQQIIQALIFYREGMDFADALHFVSSQTIEKFYTFDRNFVKTGQHLGLVIERLEQVLV
jgi:predicted nucleic-acid-binding protein